MVIPEVEEQLKQLKVENVVLMGIEVFEKQLNLKRSLLRLIKCKVVVKIISCFPLLNIFIVIIFLSTKKQSKIPNRPCLIYQ